MLNDHRQWLYRDGVESGRIFEEGEEIPEGWTDLPDSKDWDNPPPGYKTTIKTPFIEHDKNIHKGPALKTEFTPVHETVWKPPKQEIEKPDKKYPSQMNKDELMDLGTELGIELYGMTRKEMLEAINEKVKGDEQEE